MMYDVQASINCAQMEKGIWRKMIAKISMIQQPVCTIAAADQAV
jgi:hypothetical protein